MLVDPAFCPGSGPSAYSNRVVGPSLPMFKNLHRDRRDLIARARSWSVLVAVDNRHGRECSLVSMSLDFRRQMDFACQSLDS